MPSQCVISIGVFDAVHLGHRAMLQTARRLADDAGVELVVLAFDPHPAVVLRPGTQPPRLVSLAQKQALLMEAGAHRVELLSPTPELFALTPEAFIQQIVQTHQPVAMVEGYNFRFGHQRQGDVQTLTKLGETYGFATHVQPPLQVSLSDQLMTPVSSSLVRWLVGCGRVVDVARCLGRQYTLEGKVTRGEQRGRTINVPTANLDWSAQPDKLIPADGVYAGLAELADGRKIPAAISIGLKPTFAGQQLTVEAHLLDFSGDLYGQAMTLHFGRWVRDQQSFPNLDALKQQLGRDIAQTRRWHEKGLLELIRPSRVA